MIRRVLPSSSFGPCSRSVRLMHRCTAGLGSLWRTEGHTEAAEAELRAALQIDAHDFTALFNLGDLALQANQPEKAAELLEAAVKQRPKDADAHQQLAAAYALSGRIATRWCSCARRSVCRRQILTCTRYSRRRWPAPGNWSRRLRNEKPHFVCEQTTPDDWNNLGVLEARAGRITEAREDFLHALQLVPDHAQARTNLQRLPPSWQNLQCPFPWA